MNETPRTVYLQTPITDQDIADLRCGDIVFLSGHIYTAREGVYKKVVDEGAQLPAELLALTNVNFHCSPAASANDDGSYSVGAVTATASFRFNQWIERWFELSGARMIIGKGGMAEEVYKSIFVPKKAVYLTTVGYGTGALLGRGITGVHDVYWLEELGLAQALWVFNIDKMGPFIADSDQQGNSLFEAANKEINANLDKVYAGLKPPTLKRYGEKIDRKDEVI